MVRHGFSLSQHSDITHIHHCRKRHLQECRSRSYSHICLYSCLCARQVVPAACVSPPWGLGYPVHGSRKQLTATNRHQTKKCDSVSHSPSVQAHWAPGRSRRSPLRVSGCFSRCRRKAKTAAVTVKVFSADELRQDIRWVVFPRDPCHFDLLLADDSLQPEERHRHVPDLPDASPPADAPASRAIRVDPYLQVDPEIFCHGLHRETLSPALDRGVVLRLARTHGDHRLGRAPDLQASTVPHDAASIGGLPGPLTAGPIAVNEDLEILARLPDDRDSLYHPRDSPEIPAQFLDGCPATHLRTAHLAAQLLDRVSYVRPVLSKEVTPGDDGPVLPSGLPVEFQLAVLLRRPLGSHLTTTRCYNTSSRPSNFL